MYEELVKLARYCAEKDACINCPVGGCQGTTGIMNHLADAIEERDRYALTLQHEMMAEAESHIALVERLNKQIEELGMKLHGDEAAIVGMKREIERMVVAGKPRWIPVTEALPESFDDDVLVTDGEGCAVGYWRPDAQAWDSTDFGWLENRSEPPCGIHTVTHWMPLPPLPEPPKEEV